MVYVCHIVARGQFAQRTQRQCLTLRVGLLYIVFMIALKYLVIGIADHSFVVIYKALADGCRYRHKGDTCIQIVEYAAQPFQLLGVLCKYVGYIFVGYTLLQIAYQHIELAVENRLLFCGKQEGSIGLIAGYLLQRMVVPFQQMPFFYLLLPGTICLKIGSRYLFQPLFLMVYGYLPQPHGIGQVGGHLFQPAYYKLQILCPYQRIGRQEVQQRYFLFRLKAGLNIG